MQSSIVHAENRMVEDKENDESEFDNQYEEEEEESLDDDEEAVY
jgi:hypothetical protein